MFYNKSIKTTMANTKEAFMNPSTALKGTLYLGFSNTNNLTETMNQINDLICNNEDLDLENLRVLHPDIQFSLSKNELDSDLEIHEIFISNIIWVGFGDGAETHVIQKTLTEIQAWFENNESKVNGAELIAGLKTDSKFAHLQFSEAKPSELTDFIQIEIV